MLVLNLLIWNVRGLNNPARRLRIRVVVAANSASFVCFQESKLSAVSLSLVQDACGMYFMDFVYSPADGTRGGLLIAWNGDLFHASNPYICPNWVSVDCVVRSSGAEFHLFAVYGPQLEAEKFRFLTELQQLVPSDYPCIICGDFNLIAAADEKSSANVNRRTMAAFRRFINELQLLDLYLHGRRYTWSNEQAAAVMVKLDRVLYSAEWNDLFPGCLLQALSSDISYHYPMLLSLDTNFVHCRHFRFENRWVQLEGFMESVAESWAAPVNHSDAFVRSRCKLSRLGKHLKSWSARLIGDL